GCLAGVKALDTAAESKFGNDAPGFGPLRDALTEVHRMATATLKRKLELDPEPIAATPVAAETGMDEAGSGSGAGAPSTGGSISAEPTSPADAAARIVSAARYLRQTDPFNPSA